MRRRALLAAPLVLAPIAAKARNPVNPGTVQVYEGTVGNYLVRMGLAFEPGGAVAGRYGYASSQGTIPLAGELAGKRTEIANAAALLAHYGAIFTLAFVARIRAEIPHMMFVRDQGTMLGYGELRFGGAGQALAINN